MYSSKLLKTCMAGAMMSAMLFPAAASAATISNGDITPSTTMGIWGGFTVDQLADGINADTAPFNGFTTNSATGTIRLDLNGGPYDLNQFRLWNDVNVRAEGVATFRLRFFKSNGSSSYSPVFTTVPGTTAVQAFNFSTVTDIVRVDMEVLSSISQSNTYRQRIEIRELEFEGQKTVTWQHMPGEHFQCYGVEKGDQLKSEYISVRDQFGAARIVLGKPVMLCNPSQKTHRGKSFDIENKERHLVCYNIIKQEQNRPISVQINNQFAPDDIYASQRRMFCVPSSKKHLRDKPITGEPIKDRARPFDRRLPVRGR